MFIERKRINGEQRFAVMHDGGKLVAITGSRAEAERIINQGGWTQGMISRGEEMPQQVKDEALPMPSRTVPGSESSVSREGDDE